MSESSLRRPRAGRFLPLCVLLILFYCILLYLSKIAVGFW